MENHIRDCRKNAGLTQKKLSELTGITQSRICNYEKGIMPIENMTLKNAASIASACGCKIEDLFKEEKTMLKTIYFVRTLQANIKDKHFEYYEGCTMAYCSEQYGAADPEELLRTEDKAAALAELEKYKSYAIQSTFTGIWDVREYWIEAEEWDFPEEDDEDPYFYTWDGTEKYAGCEVTSRED